MLGVLLSQCCAAGWLTDVSGRRVINELILQLQRQCERHHGDDSLIKFISPRGRQSADLIIIGSTPFGHATVSNSRQLMIYFAMHTRCTTNVRSAIFRNKFFTQTTLNLHGHYFTRDSFFGQSQSASFEQPVSCNASDIMISHVSNNSRTPPHVCSRELDEATIITPVLRQLH